MKIRELLSLSLCALPTLAAAQGMGMHDEMLHEPIYTFLHVEQLEHRWTDGEDDLLAWEVRGWVGGDYHKLAFKTEGEWLTDGETESAEAQLLYSRLISDFWDVQAGIRYDFEPQPERAYAVVGFQGLARYFFEVDAHAFISDEGDVSARLEAEYELLLTQKLVLQPALEVNVAFSEDEERGIGSGLNDVELGLRLRYEIVREFAPYIGVNWERSFGDTADLAREEGEDDEEFSVVAGVQVWF